MLALHLLQNFMVCVNTLLMLQREQSGPMESLGTDEGRAVTTLFLGRVNFYGTFQFGMTA